MTSSSELKLYDAATAERWGLVNAVVPPELLMDEAKAWAAEIAAKSPTALRFLKQSFNADTVHQAGLSNLAMSALDLFTKSPEGLEGVAASAEKRTPDFRGHRSDQSGAHHGWVTVGPTCN